MFYPLKMMENNCYGIRDLGVGLPKKCNLQLQSCFFFLNYYYFCLFACFLRDPLPNIYTWTCLLTGEERLGVKYLDKFLNIWVWGFCFMICGVIILSPWCEPANHQAGCFPLCCGKSSKWVSNDRTKNNWHLAYSNVHHI